MNLYYGNPPLVSPVGVFSSNAKAAPDYIRLWQACIHCVLIFEKRVFFLFSFSFLAVHK